MADIVAELCEQNARLRSERDAALAGQAEAERTLADALALQAATAEILQAINASPTDPTRALNLITDSARRAVHADSAILRRIEGDRLVEIGRAQPTG